MQIRMICHLLYYVYLNQTRSVLGATRWTLSVDIAVVEPSSPKVCCHGHLLVLSQCLVGYPLHNYDDCVSRFD